MIELRHFIGVDLGQVSDFTALAVLEQPVPARRWQDPAWPAPPVYALRHIERVPLGTPYPDVVRRVLAVLEAPGLSDVTLIVDQTGVGRAVVDLLRDALARRTRGQALYFWPATITAGQTATTTNDGALHVPKKDLIAALQLLLQKRRLQIARALPFAETLVKELENFRVKITPAGNEVFEAWREGQHDDLVLAVALAAWLAEIVLEREAEGARQAAEPITVLRA